MAKEYPLFLAGEFQKSGERLEVKNPYGGAVVGTTFLASAEQLEAAIQSAQAAFQTTRRLPSYERERILKHIAGGIEKRKDDLARLITLQSGKPIRDAAAEVARAVLTFNTAAEESKRLGGEVIPLDWAAGSKGRLGITRRFPIGPIAGISPFNFSLNLAAHKVAPALATGNPIILKPPSQAPLTMLDVAALAQEAGVPKGALSVLPMSRALGDRLVTDDRIKMLSFTGSPPVGWDMKARAGKKKVILELGGNAGAIVDEGADLDYAAQRLAVGSFAYSGQICISVQRIYVVEAVAGEFQRRFLERVRRLKVGDPLDPETDLGPMIDEEAARRAEEWTKEAVAGGARLLAGGVRRGNIIEPTILADADPQAKVCRLEAFAPLVNLFTVKSFEEAVAQVNDSAFGLQAGVFTRDLDHALYAFRELEVGGVIINDVPLYRIDHMPYGGVKDSGYGREGLKYAMEEMTELRLMVITEALG
ncbi:MAG: aldehyde dehydrogenase family protein [Chloroflexi bacterium]|nr:aldehyde dehydrogenase family protein [Chloroflexota bacterium]